MKAARILHIALLVLFGSTFAFAQKVPGKWLTYYEKNGYTKTPRYDETLEYCRLLAAGSPWIKTSSFGRSPEGRDLMLVVASKDRVFDPARAARTGKAILLVQCGIHAGEIDGKDACLMLLRDIAITKTKSSLLDHVILLVIPIFNVDGHERFGQYNRINQNGPDEMGWRVTAQNLNLNRDYMKADAPEMQAWLKMFNQWLPDFFIDCHVTDGADFQHVVTYSIEDQLNAAESVRLWLKRKYEPVLQELKIEGIPLAPYVMFRDRLDPMKGLEGGVSPPRLSTPYVAAQNRAALLIETHMLKPYRERVDGTYKLIVSTMEVLNREHQSLKAAVRSADETMARGLKQPYPIRFAVLDTANTTFHFYGYKQKNEPSSISGGTSVVYSKEPFDADVPYFDSIRVVKAVDPPDAYIIPQQWHEVIGRLRLHGVSMERLEKPVELSVEEYQMSSPKWQEQAFEGRHSLKYTVQKLHENRSYPAGTVIVRTNQRAAGVIMQALEPEAPDAFVAWGFFDACFEQKEYSEDYVMEPLAREMLAKDTSVRMEFEAKLRSDTAFAKDPFARLNFFYQHSQYWDRQVNLYPVARLLENVALPTKPY